MGNPLITLPMESFDDELQKLAGGELLGRLANAAVTKLRSPTTLGLKSLARVGRFTKGLFQGVGEAGRRLESPIKGLKEGWKHTSPLPAMEERAKAMGFSSAAEAAHNLKGVNPEQYKEMLGGGDHLLGTAKNTGRVRAIAEELSRQGWTGSSRTGKYLPVGMKSWATVPTALAIPSIVKSPKSTPTGEGGAVERGLGELGGAAGMVMGTGLGMVPGTAMWYGGQRIGSRLGRVIDRVRAGAPLSTAATAPSPSEATKQFEDIQRYYG